MSEWSLLKGTFGGEFRTIIATSTRPGVLLIVPCMLHTGVRVLDGCTIRMGYVCKGTGCMVKQLSRGLEGKGLGDPTTA